MASRASFPPTGDWSGGGQRLLSRGARQEVGKPAAARQAIVARRRRFGAPLARRAWRRARPTDWPSRGASRPPFPPERAGAGARGARPVVACAGRASRCGATLAVAGSMASRLDDRTGRDRGQFVEHLDLLTDDTAHFAGRGLRLARQFDEAAMKLGPRDLHLALNLRGDLAHLRLPRRGSGRSPGRMFRSCRP